jgi:UDP-glucuronate 4-epimerase
MKILVTGAAGFIGHHLTQLLHYQGHEVVPVDAVIGRYPPEVKRARIKDLRNHGIVVHMLDITDAHLLHEAMESHQFDAVCHLAAQAGVRYSSEDPESFCKANLDGFFNVLEGCRRYGVKRLIYASSSSVYGGLGQYPSREDMNVNKPISFYAATKASNELMAQSYSHLFDFETVGLRFFTVYGPWGRPDMAAWIFAEKIQRDIPIPLFNAGKMVRDFTYIGDICTGIASAVKADMPSKSEVFNLGNGTPENLIDMVNIISDTLGQEARVENLPMQPGDVKRSHADISKAADILGYKPVTKISQGMKTFTNWYMANPDLGELVYKWRSKECT